MKCHFKGCKEPAAFKVTTVHDNGVPARAHHTCARVDHQHGSKRAGWTPPTKRVEHRWSILGFTGSAFVEPIGRTR